MAEACALVYFIPPSPAMAGVCTAVDNSRGVWKAPANVSLANVAKPAVDISSADQQSHNVDISGKSINAICNVVGRGSLVWSARTLDGNSQEWRYISVRRTISMIEENFRVATRSMVFEPNDANTWINMKSMIGKYLNGIWKRGGLVGEKPEHAFFVRVGLGEMMTAEDILQGKLRVSLGVALTHPTEFILVTFVLQLWVP